MELKVLIYILIAVVYIVSRALKKGQTGQQGQGQPGQKRAPKDIGHQSAEREVVYEQSRPASPNKQLTFEELLKEIAESKAKKAADEEERKKEFRPVLQTSPVVDYDDDIEEEGSKGLETVNQTFPERNRYYREYDEGKRSAFSRKSLEETMSLADTKVQFGKFKVFDREEGQNLLEKYVADFQDPEGFKKAVVMSEILNRKF